MEDITKKKHMSFKEIAAYSLGLFGFQAIVGLLNSYQAEFDGSILGANVSVVAILILVAKIVSAVADPVVGNLVDRSKSKLGKFKSMIVYSIAPLLIFTAVVFVKVPFKGVGLYVWIFLTYLVCIILHFITAINSIKANQKCKFYIILLLHSQVFISATARFTI